MEDVGSRNGTLVDGLPIGGHGPVPLESGAEIEVGETALLLARPQWRRLRRGDMAIDLEVAPGLNYSLVHCGVPLVSRLAARNTGDERTEAARLSMSVPGYAEADDVDVPMLPPWTSLEFPGPRFRFDTGALESTVEPRKARLVVALAGVPLAGEDTSGWVLAHNEWCYAPEHWVTLASFVLPNHPIVVQLAHDSGRCESGREALARVHEHLSQQWDIRCEREPPNWASDSQRLRLPHQLLLYCDRRAGRGNCIDLALLIAGILEQMRLRPIIAILDLGPSRHALIGCRLHTASILEPVIAEKSRVQEAIIWLEPTACARSPRTDFAAAAAAAEAYLAERPFLFAVDIAAARDEWITPLPFAGEPQWSAPVASAIEAAEDTAAAIGPLPTGVVHLLIGLLGRENGVTQDVFSGFGIAPDSAGEALRIRLGSQTRSVGRTGRTEHFDHALAAARATAKRCGSPFVTEGDLLRAVLQVQSSALDKALSALGADRQQVLAIATELHRTAAGGSTYSVFSEFSSAV
jgi:hypothetical protein